MCCDSAMTSRMKGRRLLRVTIWHQRNDTFNRQKKCNSLKLKEHLLAKLTRLGKRGGSRTREYIANGKQFNTAQDNKLKLKARLPWEATRGSCPRSLAIAERGLRTFKAKGGSKGKQMGQGVRENEQ